jgi:hypothetical protein
LIHKTSPSIQRIEETRLSQQLQELKNLIADNETDNNAISRLEDEIKQSCDEVISHIKALQVEYL